MQEIIEALHLTVSNETVRKTVRQLGYRRKKKSLHASEQEHLRINFEIQGFIFNVGRIYISFRSDSLPAVGRFCFTLPDRTSGKAPQCTETYIPDTVRCHRGNAVQPVLLRYCTTSQRPDSGVEIPGT